MWFSKKNQQVQEQNVQSNDNLAKERIARANAIGKIVDEISEKYSIPKKDLIRIFLDFFSMSTNDILSKKSADGYSSLFNEIKVEHDDKFIWHNVRDNLNNFFYSSISTDWLLNDLIRDNTTYTVLGENKIGKSYFVLQLALSFILQKSFLSDSYFWRFNRNRRVLYVTSNLESPIYVIKERIYEIADFYKISHDDINAFFNSFELVNNINDLFAYKQRKFFDGYIVPTDNFERLKQYIIDNKIELVIINPAQYFFDLHIGWSESAFAEIYQYFSSIKTAFLLVFNTTYYLNDEKAFENCKHRIDFYRDNESNNIKVRFFNGNNHSKKFLLSKYPFKVIDSDNKKLNNETERLNSLLNVFEAKNINEDKPFKPKFRDEIYNNNLSNQQDVVADKRFFDELNEMKADFDKHLSELNTAKDIFDKEISDKLAKIDEAIIEPSKPKPTKPKKAPIKKNKNKEVN